MADQEPCDELKKSRLTWKELIRIALLNTATIINIVAPIAVAAAITIFCGRLILGI
jgi:lipopolysaccharide export LptBFGC system permease protein LptF